MFVEGLTAGQQISTAVVCSDPRSNTLRRAEKLESLVLELLPTVA